MRALLKRIALAVPAVRRVVEDRDELLRHNGRLLRERDQALRESAALRSQLAMRGAGHVAEAPLQADDYKPRIYDPAQIPGLKTD